MIKQIKSVINKKDSRDNVKKFKIKYEEKLLWREIKNQKCLFRNQNVDFCA